MISRIFFEFGKDELYEVEGRLISIAEGLSEKLAAKTRNATITKSTSTRGKKFGDRASTSLTKSFFMKIRKQDGKSSQQRIIRFETAHD